MLTLVAASRIIDIRVLTDKKVITGLVERVAAANEGKPIEQGALASKVSHASVGDYFIEQGINLLSPPQGSKLKILPTHIEGRDFMCRHPELTETDRTYCEAALFEEREGNWIEFTRIAYASIRGSTPIFTDIRTGSIPQETRKYLARWREYSRVITQDLGMHAHIVILPSDQSGEHTTGFLRRGGLILSLPLTSTEYMELLISTAKEAGLEVRKEYSTAKDQ